MRRTVLSSTQWGFDMLDLQRFEDTGFDLTPVLFSDVELGKLISAVESRVGPVGTRGGIRDVMQRVAELRDVTEDTRVRSLVETTLGPMAFVVRATLFDKTEGANWKVPWHQDLTIAVNRRADSEGYGPWSLKEGVQHVQPPSKVLENMVSIRLHLDDCPADNGALRVMPGTHQLGRLDQHSVARYIHEPDTVCCEAKAGTALIMRPLLLHASSASDQRKHRRVLHFDYARGDLANGMTWELRA